MGFLTDYVIKDEKKKKYLAWAKDLVILGIFIYMALSHRATWQAGYDYCAENACLVCMNEIEPIIDDYGQEYEHNINQIPVIQNSISSPTN